MTRSHGQAPDWTSPHLDDAMQAHEFNDEAEMQVWLSKSLDDGALADLIKNGSEFKMQEAQGNDPSCKIRQSFLTCLESLYITEKVFDNENISTDEGEILKPDFILYAPETESVIVVELKNQRNATRQAGTELGGYSAEIKSAIPFLSDGDIVHVLISPIWPTLLKHYVRHQIYWQRKNLICLEPFQERDGTVWLRIAPVELFAEDHAQFTVGERYLGGWHICLYGRKNADLADCREVMTTALVAASTTGNRTGSHGFAYLWEDPMMPNHESVARYFITIVNFAPYQSLEKFLHTETPGENLPPMIHRFMRLANEYCPEGHGNTLGEITDSCISMLKPVCRPMVEGFYTWLPLEKEITERGTKLAFAGWGTIGDIALRKLEKAYADGETQHGIYSAVLGDEVVAEVVDQNYEYIPFGWMFIGEEWPDIV